MTKLRSSVFGWKSVWMDLAEETDGEFADGPQGALVRVPLKQTPWTVTIKLNQQGIGPSPKSQTTVSVPFKSTSDFGFALHNKTWLEEVAKPFGLQDIIIGDTEFDREYIIQGTDASIVRDLLSEPTLRDLIDNQKHVKLTIHRDTSHLAQYGAVPAGVHVLNFTEDSAINSFERLNGLQELMRALMYELCRVGVAEKSNPGFVI